jgi:hypothetical protein
MLTFVGWVPGRQYGTFFKDRGPGALVMKEKKDPHEQ